MEYTQGLLGRVFILKFFHDDDILECLKPFIKKEKIKTAVIQLMGAVQYATLVTGPKQPKIPPDPQWETITGGWETIGMGTVFSDKQGPHIHIHATFGSGKKTRTGCLRKTGKVFLVVEAIVTEIKNTRAEKQLDQASGLELLHIATQPKKRKHE